MTDIRNYDCAMPRGDMPIAFLERLCLEQIATLGLALQARMLAGENDFLAARENEKAAAALARAQGALSLHLTRLHKAAEARPVPEPKTAHQKARAARHATSTPVRATALLEAVATGRAAFDETISPEEIRLRLRAEAKEISDDVQAQAALATTHLAALEEMLDNSEADEISKQRRFQAGIFGKSKNDNQFTLSAHSVADDPMPDDLETKSAFSAEVNIAALEARRRRGAPKGNANALKTGRRTARAIARRAEIRRLVHEARNTCAMIGDRIEAMPHRHETAPPLAAPSLAPPDKREG